MNTVDLAILAIMLLSAIVGVMRGFTREILGLCSWAAAGFSAFFALPLVQPIAHRYIENLILADILSSIVLFVIFLILYSLISQFFAGMVRQSGLGGIDRSLGFGYGLLRGFIFICIAEIGLGIFLHRGNYPPLILDSHLQSTIFKGSDYLFSLLPKGLQETFGQTKKRINQENTNLFLQSNDLAKESLSRGTKAVVPLLDQKNLESTGSKISTPSSKKNDNEYTVEKLSNLTPKAVDAASSHPNYSKKHRLDMDRLLNQDDSLGQDETP